MRQKLSTGLAFQKVVTRKDLIVRITIKNHNGSPGSVVRLHKAWELSLGF